MARKPNYKFERMERDRAKAAKKAARLKEKSEQRKADDAGLELDSDALADAPAESSDKPKTDDAPNQ